MDRQETITLLQLQRGAQLVTVRFTNKGRDGGRYPSRPYTFKSVFPLKPGDLVVVEDVDGFKVGSVDKVGVDYQTLEEEGTTLGALRHVVGAVDLTRHASVKLEERSLLDVIMRAELNDRLKAVTDSPIFQALMATPTPAVTGFAVTEQGTKFNPATGEVIG